jgi:purine-binding chemotaxis protein CheW
MSNTPDALILKARELARDFDRSFSAAPAAVASSTTLDFLVVRIGTETYALRLTQVRGLIADPRVTRVPSPDARLLGVVAVRGAIVPVFSLPLLLGHASGPRPSWMVLAGKSDMLGLAFDSYDSLLRAGPDQVAAAAGEEHGRAWLHQIVRVGERSLPVVDVPALVDDIANNHRNVGPKSGPLTRSDPQ